MSIPSNISASQFCISVNFIIAKKSMIDTIPKQTRFALSWPRSSSGVFFFLVDDFAVSFGFRRTALRGAAGRRLPLLSRVLDDVNGSHLDATRAPGSVAKTHLAIPRFNDRIENENIEFLNQYQMSVN